MQDDIVRKLFSFRFIPVFPVTSRRKSQFGVFNTSLNLLISPLYKETVGVNHRPCGSQHHPDGIE